MREGADEGGGVSVRGGGVGIVHIDGKQPRLVAPASLKHRLVLKHPHLHTFKRHKASSKLFFRDDD